MARVPAQNSRELGNCQKLGFGRVCGETGTSKHILGTIQSIWVAGFANISILEPFPKQNRVFRAPGCGLLDPDGGPRAARASSGALPARPWADEHPLELLEAVARAVPAGDRLWFCLVCQSCGAAKTKKSR